MAASHSSCPGALSLQTHQRLYHQEYPLKQSWPIYPRILRVRQQVSPTLSHLIASQHPPLHSATAHVPRHTGSPCPQYLMLVISFLMESETVREWPASTDQRGGSRGLTARARAVWISPPALSSIVLAEITMGSMAARPWEERRGVSLMTPKEMRWQLAHQSSLHVASPQG